MPSLSDLYSNWEQAAIGSDINSIQNQLISIDWRMAYFQILRKYQMWATPDAEGRKQFCHGLASFISINFVQAVSVGIRKILLDDTTNKKKERGVNSIKNILLEIQKYRAILKRSELWTLIQQGACKRKETCHKEDFDICFDFFSKKTKPTRDKPDVPEYHFIEKLVSKINSYETLYIKINKLVAHSATVFSREHADVGEIILNLDELEEAYTTTRKIFCLIVRLLFGRLAPSFLQPSHFILGNLDQPFFSTMLIPRAKMEWEAFAKKNSTYQMTVTSLYESIANDDFGTL